MKKAAIQLFCFLSIFFCLWLGLSAINWTSILRVDEKRSSLEKKLGDMYVEWMVSSENLVKDEQVKNCFDSLKSVICDANGIDASKVKLYLVEDSQVNAFALPDNNMIVYTGLIEYSRSMEEVLGVISHEIAHMQKGHIMKKLSREIGFTALTSMASGGSVGIEAVRYMTSTAYDRSMETEADDTAVEYMRKSGYNPAALADFMYRLSLEESDFMRNFSFLSTHPASSDRAIRIIELSDIEGQEFVAALTTEQWEEMRAKLELKPLDS